MAPGEPAPEVRVGRMLADQSLPEGPGPVGILQGLIRPAGELVIASEDEIAPGQVVLVFGDVRVFAGELLPDGDGPVKQDRPRGS